MKNLFSIISLTITSIVIFAQSPALEVQKIILDNGFTVYLNVDNTANDVFGAVVVKAGSKNDPADATGIAHYLEHLLFKGTTELGTLDYQKEKPYLDSINIYYDSLGKTTDKIARERIQKLINNQSLEASKYGLPSEFDKLLKSIGSTNVNAFTSSDMTIYLNSFPCGQIEKWLDIYSHRFQNPVFRSFQSELEVVYEEKNRSMDSFESKLIEEMNRNLFKHHPYGTQTTLGAAVHLKNPSFTKMYEFFNKYYVANNMALVLCGNFEIEKALPIIKEKFSKLKTAVVPPMPKFPETIFSEREVKTVRYTPIKVGLLGYKTVPDVHTDKAALEVFTSLLYNGSETGKLNELQREGKFLYSGCFNYTYNDDGAVIFFIVPKIIGQSFNSAEKILIDEIGKIKKGEIPDTNLQIIKTEIYCQRQQRLENLGNRVFNIANTFCEGSTWGDFLDYNKKIEKITKEDVMQVANKYFGNNYFALHSKMGFPKKETIQKPGYKPVVTKQIGESAYAKGFKQAATINSLPKFLDFEKDASLLQLNESNKLYVTSNPINDLFTLQVAYSIGSDSLKNLDLVSSLFYYFHTKDLTTNNLKKEFALLGLTYYTTCDANRFSITFTGVESNLEKSLALINTLINEAEVDQKSVKIIQNELVASRRAMEKEPKDLGKALYEYARLGKKSPYIDRISKSDLKKLKAEELLSLYKKAIPYNAVWHYVGNQTIMEVKGLFLSNITLPNNKKELPITVKTNNPTSENIIYLVNDKKALQSQIYFLVNSNNYNPTSLLDARIRAFNQYMGGDFSGLILQEIREYRSLAYSSYGSFIKPKLQNYPAYFNSFVGCQADKTIEAVETMHNLLTNMPQIPERIDVIKPLLKNSASSHYPNFRGISDEIEALRQSGYTSLPLKDEYIFYDSLTFNDIISFYDNYIKDKPITITIYGNKSKIDLPMLSKYGKIIELKKKDIILD